MSYGYSAKTIQLNKQADSSRLGVALGKAAIKLGISVADVATTIGVSRQRYTTGLWVRTNPINATLRT